MDTRNLPEEPQQVEPLQLYPPILPGWTTPVEGYDGGIGVGAVEGGLRFVINPWLNMAVDDQVSFFTNNETDPVWRKTIEAGEEDKPVSGVIDAGHIIRGDLYPLFYTVTRTSQEPEASTPKRKLLVKLDRPGGYDDNYDEDGHSNLRYSIPQTIIDNGVGADEAAAGIPITILPYPFMRVNDRIHLIWGGKRIIVKVERDHVEDPLNHPLIVLIDKATIEQVGDGTRIPVYYQVVDEVGNYPDERSPWSATTYLSVDLKQNRLDAPIVLDAHPDTGVVDLDDLGEADVTVLVNTTGGAFKVGDMIAPKWVGTPAEGSQVIHEPAAKPVVRVGIAVTFDIPNAKVKAIAKGRASVSFVLKSADSADRPSKNASVRVEGDVSRLQAPQVLEAPGGQLPADVPRATVSVPYHPGRGPGDLITVHWEGTRPGGGETYYPIRIIVADEAENTPIERDVPASEILPLDGGSVKVHYTVANDDVMLSSVRNSLPLNLTVGVAQPDLEKPKVTQADANDVLLPEAAPTGADVTAPFTGTVPGDTVGLRWVGSISGAHPSYEIPLSTHTAGQPVPFRVIPKYIEANRNGTADVSYYVKRPQQPTRNSKIRTLSIGVAQPQWDAPTVLEAPSGQLDPNTHKTGFTVRVDTTALQDNDGIDLIVEGRIGEGSVRPERRYVSGTAPIDFPIAAPITGANIGREVNIRYDVVRASGPLPSKTLPLQVGTLKVLPMPQLGGFEGGSFNPSAIKDTTQVICNQWPFQLYGAPVWVSYIEHRSDGTSRDKIPTSGTPNNHNDGLALAAEVQWLRECVEGSTVSMELRVGLFKAATWADAVLCPVRVYTVKTLFDDLTTFTGGDRNGWLDFSPNYASKVSEEGGNFFLEVAREDLYIRKTFHNLNIGVTFELSFQYYILKSIPVFIYRTGLSGYRSELMEPNKWSTFTLRYTNNSSHPDISINSNYIKLDNIQFKQIP